MPTHPYESSYEIRDTGSCPIVYYKLIEDFLQEMGSNTPASSQLPPALPSYLTNRLRQVQEMVLDSLWLLMEYDANPTSGGVDNLEPSFIGMINKLRERPSSWPVAPLRDRCPIQSGMPAGPSGTPESSKESMFVGYIVHKILMLTERRLKTLCIELSSSNSNEMASSESQHQVREKTMTLFTSLMCYRVDMFFNRHPDQIMLCALYMVCCKMDLAPKITFGSIVRAYESSKREYLKPIVIQKILYRIQDCTADGSKGDIISFYNVSMLHFIIVF